jgi:hypothetical protein
MQRAVSSRCCAQLRLTTCLVLNVVLAVFLALQVPTMLQAYERKAIQVYGTLHAPDRKLRRHLKRDKGSKKVEVKPNSI